MRFRIYKRKVVILTVVVVICGLAFWSSGRQKKSDSGPLPKEVETVRKGSSVSSSSINNHIQVQATAAVSKAPAPPPIIHANDTHQEIAKEKEQIPKLETDNTTLVYRSIVFQLNFDQTIRNEEKFKAVRQKDDLVVVVQVLQIFFPFSIQLYPEEFPGHDPKDCPRDLPKNDALKLGCINAEYPDSFGHYREAKFSQTKHHWWWKLHFVWDRVRVLKDHKGMVLLIEEDHYVSPDFIHLLKLMSSLKREQCPDCDILSLGSYSHIGYSSKANRVEVKAWKSTEHNMGMALSRETYQKLIKCTDTFCTYDDYNWDWSLQHLTVSCLPSYWKVMVSEAPRVFHAGDCGMHHKKTACMPISQKTKIDNILQSSGNQLFPKNLLITKRLPANGAGGVAPHVKNGGWGDIRDHELCKSYVRLQ
ncbi:hypothetical protein CesoFtcFv8_023340 [Champsocephalus esox]|uniref:Alpha-1,6-mannosyl-glycoprotein 2-beta-N-acetylglucosaminyltransferase n=1 Tax=Champsocephalus esox TaxID=159716 RepID=A0AAN8GJV5_9TELE|nr:hypothetical protein CesoFtcFv8_023340 [Champsocephalus esox]